MRLAYGECPTYGMLFICVFPISISLSFVAPPPLAISPNDNVNSETSVVEESFQTHATLKSTKIRQN